LGSAFMLNDTCLVTGTSSLSCSGGATIPPVCPTFTESSDAKTQGSSYTWYLDGDRAAGTLDGAAGPSPRKPKTESVVAGKLGVGSVEATSTYAYDGFGNPLTKVVSARDVPANPGTTYGYTSDGYFLETQTNVV